MVRANTCGQGKGSLVETLSKTEQECSLASLPIAKCLSGEDRSEKHSLALAALPVVASEEVVQAVAIALVCLWGVPLVAEVVGIWVDAQEANETVQLPNTILQQRGRMGSH